MEFMSFIWPYTSYKFSEFYKKYFNESIGVQTSLGPVKGLKQTSTYGYEYIEFRGIPYGKPPVGNLRFCDPEPATSWTEPLNTVTDTACCQRDIFFRRIVGQEDCLHVNIYTKNLTPAKPYPVMVFLHGGAFIYGSNTKDVYSPEYLLQKDIILVVVNYRIGAFGFLSFDDPDVGIPGNAGLKDQVLALKWINKNIQYFGGDINNITLFGESAGGCAVHFHMLSNMSRGLFHKASAMSGTALNVWALGPIKDTPERLAKNLGWDGTGGYKKIVEILRSASAENLTKAQDDLITREERKRFITFPFGPVVEPYESTQCFIPKSPLLMSREPWSSHIPFMIGGCSGEGLFMYRITKKNQHFLVKLNGFFENIVPSKLESDKASERCKALGAKIKQQYFGTQDVSFAVVDKYLQLLGDLWFWHGIHCTLKSRLSFRNSAETYLYRFDFDSQIQNHSKFFFAEKGVAGTCHADDCSYLFKYAITVPVKNDSREYKTVQRMVSKLKLIYATVHSVLFTLDNKTKSAKLKIDLWTSFAITGKPTNESEPETCDIWQPIENGGKPFKCLNISDNLELINQPEYERMLFWDSLYTGIDLY